MPTSTPLGARVSSVPLVLNRNTRPGSNLSSVPSPAVAAAATSVPLVATLCTPVAFGSETELTSVGAVGLARFQMSILFVAPLVTKSRWVEGE